MQTAGYMLLKGVNRVYNDKIGSNGLERSQLGIQCKNQVIWSWKESIGYTMIIGWNGLERSQLGTQYKNKVKWSWKESIGYTMLKWCQMVLKGVNLVNYNKISSDGLERSQ